MMSVLNKKLKLQILRSHLLSMTNFITIPIIYEGLFKMFEWNIIEESGKNIVIVDYDKEIPASAYEIFIQDFQNQRNDFMINFLHDAKHQETFIDLIEEVYIEELKMFNFSIKIRFEYENLINDRKYYNDMREILINRINDVEHAYSLLRQRQYFTTTNIMKFNPTRRQNDESFNDENSVSDIEESSSTFEEIHTTENAHPDDETNEETVPSVIEQNETEDQDAALVIEQNETEDQDAALVIEQVPTSSVDGKIEQHNELLDTATTSKPAKKLWGDIAAENTETPSMRKIMDEQKKEVAQQASTSTRTPLLIEKINESTMPESDTPIKEVTLNRLREISSIENKFQKGGIDKSVLGFYKIIDFEQEFCKIQEDGKTKKDFGLSIINEFNTDNIRYRLNYKIGVKVYEIVENPFYKILQKNKIKLITCYDLIKIKAAVGGNKYFIIDFTTSMRENSCNDPKEFGKIITSSFQKEKKKRLFYKVLSVENMPPIPYFEIQN
jgi:hypothetical protein